MPYRFALSSLAAVLVLAACSGDDDSAGTTTTRGDDTTTTTAPEVTTTTEAETTTTDDTAAETTTTVADTAPPEGAPTTELDSFTATSVVEVEVGDTAVQVATEGTYANNDFECTSVIDFGGLNVATGAVVVGESVWVDDGEGYQPAELFEAEDVLATCPVYPAFWADFEMSDIPPDVQGTPDTINGIPAQQLDFADDLELAAGMGLADDLEGAEFERFDIWLADDGGWIAGLLINATLSGDSAASAFGGLPFEPGSTATMVMDIQIADVDDPSLTVESPEG